MNFAARMALQRLAWLIVHTGNATSPAWRRAERIERRFGLFGLTNSLVGAFERQRRAFLGADQASQPTK